MTGPRDTLGDLERRRGRPSSGTLQALRDEQARAGTLGPAEVTRVADRLGLPAAAVYGAATFFADLALPRRGSRHVRVCDGTACFVAAGGRHVPAVAAALGTAAGGCAADGSLSLQRVACLGYCYAAPAVLDGDDPRTGPDVAEQLAGRAPPRDPPIPVRAAVAEPFALAGVVGAADRWQVWPNVVTRHEATRVLAAVTAAGLRGRGGAEFPTARKWTAVAAGPPGPRYVVANGDEGDPGSYADRLLMEQDPHRVLEGLALAGLACGAEHGFVYVRAEYPRAGERLRAAVTEAGAAGLLGPDVLGSGVAFDVEVVAGAGSYVAGEETSLLASLEGQRGAPRPRPPYPTSAGLLGRPTAVNNVETLAAVPEIVRRGGHAFAGLGVRPETGTKLVCLNERFRSPGVYEVALGTPLRTLVEDLGGGLRNGYRLRAVQVGGPLGGFLAADDLDVPLLDAALTARGAALGHAGLVAVDDTVPGRALLDHLWQFVASESCGGCAPCRIGTRRGAELLAAEKRAVPAEFVRILDVMAEASLCGFGRGAVRAVRGLLRVYGEETAG